MRSSSSSEKIPRFRARRDAGSLCIGTCTSSRIAAALHFENQENEEKFIHKLLNSEADINSIEERR
jgi:hypothetical protein